MHEFFQEGPLGALDDAYTDADLAISTNKRNRTEIRLRRRGNSANRAPVLEEETIGSEEETVVEEEFVGSRSSGSQAASSSSKRRSPWSDPSKSMKIINDICNLTKGEYADLISVVIISDSNTMKSKRRMVLVDDSLKSIKKVRSQK